MSTQINVTVGDQRLLQTNKTRAAANQQNLDDRLTANQTTAALEPELEKKRQEEEQPGAIPVRRIPRRPAAQRRIQETALLFYDSLRPQPVPNSEVTVSRTTTFTVGIATWTPSVQNFVYSTVNYTANLINSPPLKYRSLHSQPVVSTYGILLENLDPNQVLGLQSSETLTPYTTYYDITNSGFAWPTSYTTVQQIGIGGKGRQTFVNTFTDFFSSYYTSTLHFDTAVQSSTLDYTFVSYAIQYKRLQVYKYVSPVFKGSGLGWLGKGIVPNSVPPVSFQSTSIALESITTYKVGVYLKTDHKTKTTTYRTVILKEDTVQIPIYEGVFIFQPPIITEIFTPLTEQEQKDFIANMDFADPRRAIYAETSRLDYALDTVINGCMYNPKTGGAYATGFDSEGKKVIVAKGQLQQNLDYYTALLVKTKPAAAAIKNSVASQVSAQLPAEFSIYNQFTNTVGTDPLYGPGDLGRMFVAYGT